MTSKWQFFQRNLGEWHGTFASLDSQQQEQSCTSSILTLEQGDEQSLVLFSLKCWSDASLKGVAIERGDPLDAMQQEVRNLGKQVVFFMRNLQQGLYAGRTVHTLWGRVWIS